MPSPGLSSVIVVPEQGSKRLARFTPLTTRLGFSAQNSFLPNVPTQLTSTTVEGLISCWNPRKPFSTYGLRRPSGSTIPVRRARCGLEGSQPWMFPCQPAPAGPIPALLGGPETVGAAPLGVPSMLVGPYVGRPGIPNTGIAKLNE